MVSASYSERAFTGKRPDLAEGGLRLPYGKGGLHSFGPPRTVSACKAAILEDDMDGCLSNAEWIIAKLHVNCGHASARPLKQVSPDLDGGDMHLDNNAESCTGSKEVRRTATPLIPRGRHSPFPGFGTRVARCRRATGATGAPQDCPLPPKRRFSAAAPLQAVASCRGSSKSVAPTG